MMFKKFISSQLWISIATGLQGAAVMLPVSLGSVYFVFSYIAPDKMGYAIFACCLSLSVIHLFTAWSERPVGYANRFFEAATLLSMSQQLDEKLSAIQVQSTSELLLISVCCMTTLAGVFFGLLWWFKAQRFMRFVPSPVYVGFINSTVIMMFVSQASSLWKQIHSPDTYTWAVISVFLMTLLSIILVSSRKKNWPSTIIGLIIGSLPAAAIAISGASKIPMLSQTTDWVSPYAVSDFGFLMSIVMDHASFAFLILQNGCILGLLVFLNTAVTSQLLLQDGDKPELSVQSKCMETLGMVFTGLTGVSPVSGTPVSVKAMLRKSHINTAVMLTLSGITFFLYYSGSFTYIPLAALCALLCFEAWSMWDKIYTKDLFLGLSGGIVARHHKEDALLVTAVIAASLLTNMVLALLVGFFLGLLLHAHRNTRVPVRRVMSGLQISSNCARSNTEIFALQQRASEIKVFELDSHQYFGSADVLNDCLRIQMTDCNFAILDWSLVHSIDTSIASMLVRLEKWALSRGVSILHAGSDAQDIGLLSLLKQYLPKGHFYQDLDRALETAENRLLANTSSISVSADASDLEDIGLLRGLNSREQLEVKSRMSAVVYEPGDFFIEKGDPSDFILLIQEGVGSVVLFGRGPHEKRLAGFRAGALLGEVGFLDCATRSASVIAETQIRAFKLHRNDFDALAISHPRIIQKILQNMSLDLATRLRRTSIQAVMSR